MAGIKIQIQGLDSLLAKTTAKKRMLGRKLDPEVSKAVNAIISEAKSKVPVDTGRLKGSIGYTKLGVGSYSIDVDTYYWPYVEFGTGKFVRIPKGWDNYAAQFKGKGIKEVNQKAQPFLIRGIITQTRKLQERVQKLFSKW